MSEPPPEPASGPPPLPLRLPQGLPPGPPPKKGLSTVAIVLIVLGVVALLFVGGVVMTVATVVPQMQEKQKQLTCQQNLSQLGTVFVDWTINHPDEKPRSGSALFLGWRKDKSQIKGGREDVLLCPGDTRAHALATEADRRAYDAIDLAADNRAFCSYAVRDFGRFPLPEDPVAEEPIATCLHHEKGPVVVFDNARVRMMTWSEAGLSDASQAEVGPGAKSPVLKVLCYRPGVTEK